LDTIQLLGNQNGVNATGFSSVSIRNSMLARNSNNGFRRQHHRTSIWS
jgi:hypothetical protein